jgi:hypothetical protein
VISGGQLAAEPTAPELEPETAEAPEEAADTKDEGKGEAEEETGGRLYTTQSERREAGLKHAITPWLTASYLLELEALIEKFALRGAAQGDQFSEAAASFQLGLVAAPLAFAKGDLVLEFDSYTGKLFVEEAFLSFEAEPLEVEVGKMYTPFGAYISHFAMGPILELGETRANGATAALGPNDRFDLAVAAYRGSARGETRESRDWDWAFSLEAWPSEGLSLGLSYQSDLADADSRPLSDHRDRYIQRVGAASGYLIWSNESLEVSFEALGALRDFEELDGDRNRPFAWNLEFTRFVDSIFEWSIRVEGSEEVEDEPQLQLGPSLTWRLTRTSALTLEYLRGRFKRELATNDDDEPYDHVDRFAAQLSILF